MLFNDPIFLFIFLPIVVILFHWIRRDVGGSASMVLIVAASIFFYGWWNPPYLLLLLGSVLFNYAVTHQLLKSPSRLLLIVGVLANIAVLGYFKYRNFFMENIGLLLGESWQFEEIFIPLAISFFTFQQVALLVDAQDGQIKRVKFLDFATFVILFPQLIAGPIVLYREMDKQFQSLRKGTGAGLSLFGLGVVTFIVGLFKKVALADGIAPFADSVFRVADQLTMLEAWGGVIAYTLQLYFDFSGYSDMAVGLGMMFGFLLPINFNLPYRATSMIDFWKRWHMTMTRFFMMYLYSPIALSVMRESILNSWSKQKQFLLGIVIPIVITFLASGLWHGAAWTFVAFGAVNALGLIVNHIWKEWRLPKPHMFIGWLLTMLTVMISFVYFRADNITNANLIIITMIDPASFIFPNWLSYYADYISIPWHTLTVFSSGTYTVRMIGWIITLVLFSLLLKNRPLHLSEIQPTTGLAISSSVFLWVAVGWLDEPSTFIYFQF
jgi:alginate O-acetyltransferase complex protein AlgI